MGYLIDLFSKPRDPSLTQSILCLHGRSVRTTARNLSVPKTNASTNGRSLICPPFRGTVPPYSTHNTFNKMHIFRPLPKQQPSVIGRESRHRRHADLIQHSTSLSLSLSVAANGRQSSQLVADSQRSALLISLFIPTCVCAVVWELEGKYQPLTRPTTTPPLRSDLIHSRICSAFRLRQHQPAVAAQEHVMSQVNPYQCRAKLPQTGLIVVYPGYPSC